MSVANFMFLSCSDSDGKFRRRLPVTRHRDNIMMIMSQQLEYYVVTDGVPIFHADFDLKVPIRPSQAEKFTHAPASNRGTRVTMLSTSDLSLIQSMRQLDA